MANSLASTVLILWTTCTIIKGCPLDYVLWYACTFGKSNSQTDQHEQAASGDFPHMLFYGPSGAGKKTRIACTLRQLFGVGVEKVRASRPLRDVDASNGLVTLAQNRPTRLLDPI